MRKLDKTILRELSPILKAHGLEARFDRRGIGQTAHPSIAVTVIATGETHDLPLANSPRSCDQNQANYSRQHLNKLIAAQGWKPLPKPDTIALTRLAAHNGPASDRRPLTNNQPAPDQHTKEPTVANTKTKNCLSLSHKIDVLEHLKTIITKHEDGTCEYAHPHTDLSVASDLTILLETIVSEGNVAGVRKELFGPTRRQRPKTLDLQSLQQQLDRLQRAFRQYAQEQGMPSDSVEDLITNLLGEEG